MIVLLPGGAWAYEVKTSTSPLVLVSVRGAPNGPKSSYRKAPVASGMLGSVMGIIPDWTLVDDESFGMSGLFSSPYWEAPPLI